MKTLAQYGRIYRQNLDRNVLPFWLKYSPDRKHGGFYSCLTRTGEIYDTKKYLWFQGRMIWLLARLYNEWNKNPEYLKLAGAGVKFMRKHGRDPAGRVYFSVTREGRPVFFQRKPYAAVFYMLGLWEYYRATGDQACRAESLEVCGKIAQWIKNPGLLGRAPLSGQPPTSNLANCMVLANMALELMKEEQRPRYVRIIRDAITGVLRHYDARRRLLRENVPLDARQDLNAWPEGRFFNPGHSIETAWFLLRMLEHCPDARHRQIALDAIEGSLEFGWDKKYGGLFYFMDVENQPTIPLESDMKLWWPHLEAIYAVLLAYKLTGEKRWLAWLAKLHDYTFGHFVDRRYGGWFGYLDRRGNVTNDCKGNNYLACYHVTRSLMMSAQLIEKI